MQTLVLEITKQGETKKERVIIVNKEEEVQTIASNYFAKDRVLSQYGIAVDGSRIANEEYYIFECYPVDAPTTLYKPLYCAMKKK